MVAASIAVGSVYYVKGIRRLDAAATRNSALSFSDREIAGGSSVVVDQSAAYQARALIPRTGRYRVLVGRVRGETKLTRAYAPGWFEYFLLPRRPDPTGRWVVCYGCDTKPLGALAVHWRDKNAIVIGRIR